MQRAFPEVTVASTSEDPKTLGNPSLAFWHNGCHISTVMSLKSEHLFSARELYAVVEQG
jgi:hypothetical protein